MPVIAYDHELPATRDRAEGVLGTHLARLVNDEEIKLQGHRLQILGHRERAHEEDGLDALHRFAGPQHQLPHRHVVALLPELIGQDAHGARGACRTAVDVGSGNLIRSQPNPVPVRTPEPPDETIELIPQDFAKLRILSPEAIPFRLVDRQRQDRLELGRCDFTGVSAICKPGTAEPPKPTQAVPRRCPVDQELVCLGPLNGRRKQELAGNLTQVAPLEGKFRVQLQGLDCLAEGGLRSLAGMTKAIREVPGLLGREQGQANTDDLFRMNQSRQPGRQFRQPPPVRLKAAPVQPERRSDPFTNGMDRRSGLLELNQGVELLQSNPILARPVAIPVPAHLCDGIPVGLREEPEERGAPARDFNADLRPVALERAWMEGLTDDRLQRGETEPRLDGDAHLRENVAPTTIGDDLLEPGRTAGDQTERLQPLRLSAECQFTGSRKSLAHGVDLLHKRCRGFPAPYDLWSQTVTDQRVGRGNAHAPPRMERWRPARQQASGDQRRFAPDLVHIGRGPFRGAWEFKVRRRRPAPLQERNLTDELEGGESR